MEFKIKDRVIAQTIILKEGGLVDLTLAQSVIDKVKFSINEITEFEMKDTQTGTSWNPKKDMPKEIALTHEEISILKKSILIKDEAGQLHLDMLSFCKKIMEI